MSCDGQSADERLWYFEAGEEMIMAILDAGPFLDWIRAFDGHQQAQKRYNAAGGTGNDALINYLRPKLDEAARDLNAATKALNNQFR
jgi:hypothetical protein